MKKGANPDIKTFFTPATKRIAHCELQRAIPSEESNTAMMDGAVPQNCTRMISEGLKFISLGGHACLQTPPAAHFVH